MISRAPRAARNRAAALPLTPSPITITRLSFSSIALQNNYLSFSVLSATSAQTIEMIQKRTTTTVSGQPANSK